MKKIFHKIIVVLVAVVALWSCKKDEVRVVAQAGTQPALTATATDVVLQESEADNDAITFNWSPSDFGYNAAVNYSIQFGKKDSNFVNAKTISVGSALSAKYTVSALNKLAMDMGLPAFQKDTVEVRIKAQLSDSYAPVYSNPVTVVITPYLLEPPYATVYLVGDATENGWDNSKATPVFRDPADPFVYTYTGYLKSGYLKFLGYLNKWAPQWGTNGSGDLVFRETEAQPDPGSINVPNAGYYTVTLNLRSNTYTVAPYSVPAGITTYNSIGIIGSFNGWGDIVPMHQSGINPHYWDLAYTFTSDAELKFRIAKDWSVNWGATGDPEKLYGIGGQDKANIKVTAGTYRILFNDLTASYIFIKQ